MLKARLLKFGRSSRKLIKFSSISSLMDKKKIELMEPQVSISFHVVILIQFRHAVTFVLI